VREADAAGIEVRVLNAESLELAPGLGIRSSGAR